MIIPLDSPDALGTHPKLYIKNYTVIKKNSTTPPLGAYGAVTKECQLLSHGEKNSE